MKTSVKRMIIGGIMLLVGWLIIMGAVIDIIPQLVWLAFLAYGLSLFGFVIGIVGVVMYARTEGKN